MLSKPLIVLTLSLIVPFNLSMFWLLVLLSVNETNLTCCVSGISFCMLFVKGCLPSVIKNAGCICVCPLASAKNFLLSFTLPLLKLVLLSKILFSLLFKLFPEKAVLPTIMHHPLCQPMAHHNQFSQGLKISPEYIIRALILAK